MTLKPKDIVMIDNSRHTSCRHPRGVAQRFALRYSLDPIEVPFSKLKADLANSICSERRLRKGVTVMGQKLALSVYCSPTALQRLFHHEGEHAVAAAAARYRTRFGVSSLGTVSLEELRKAHDTSK
jgi:hypothetical protein